MDYAALEQVCRAVLASGIMTALLGGRGKAVGRLGGRGDAFVVVLLMTDLEQP
jgi:hypothetical protein